MKSQRSQRDLVVLVADRDTEAALQGLLSRPQSLGTRPVEFTIYRHPGRDAGCRSQGNVFLRAFCRQFRHAVLIFDREGSGREQHLATEIESEMEDLLSRSGWGDRAACIVLDPELEIWVWSDSPHVDRVMGWSGRIPALRDWLVQHGYANDPQAKPPRPKETFQHALRFVRKQVSSALFRELAEHVSLRRCTDRAFQRLLILLRGWFPASTP